MVRYVALPALLIASFAVAQEPKIVKSEAIEMKAAEEVNYTKIREASTIEVLGGADVTPAPATCAATKDQARLDCLSREVLRAIQAKLRAAGVQADDSGYPLTVIFTLNEYGEIRSVQAERTYGTDLTKHVIVALNGMRDISPGMKGGEAIGTSVRVTYPASVLFDLTE